jgi:hypothetical protein
LRVGPIGPGWWVRCESLGTDRGAWDASGDAPVVRVGTADESYSRFYSFLLTDRQSGAAIVEVRAASIVGGVEPKCFAENGRLFVLTDGWVSEVDTSTKTIAWEYLADAPIMDAWLLRDGRLLVVSETEVVSLDARGRKVWRETISVSDYRRESPFLHITGDDGSRLVLDETTGALAR